MPLRRLTDRDGRNTSEIVLVVCDLKALFDLWNRDTTRLGLRSPSALSLPINSSQRLTGFCEHRLGLRHRLARAALSAASASSGHDSRLLA